MSWASIVSKAPSATPSKKTSKGPVRLDGTHQESKESAAAAIAGPVSQTAAAPAKIAPVTAQPVPKVSSWAEKVRTNVNSTGPNAAPKEPAPLQAPAKTSVASNNVFESSTSRSAFSNIADGWGQLPSDILSHHLAPVVKHPSTIRVLRRLNRHYAKCIPLPSVHMELCKGVKLFLPALSLCESANVMFSVEDEKDFKEATEYLKMNTRLRDLTLRCYGHIQTESIEFLASVLESAVHLQALSLTLCFISDSQMALLADALQRQKPRLKSVMLYFRGHELGKNAAAFFRCLASKDIQNIELHIDRIQPEVKQVIADWLASPSCSLIKFFISCPRVGEVTSIITDGVKRNRSLRSLKLQHLCSVSSSELVDAVLQQGRIEYLYFCNENDCRLKELFDLVTKNERVKCEGEVFAGRITNEPYVTEKVVCDYIRSQKCSSDFGNIEGLLWKHRNSPQLADALKANRTIETMTIAAGKHSNDEEHQYLLIASSQTLWKLSIENFAHCSATLSAALRQNKTLRKIRLDNDDSLDPEASEMRKMIFAIGQVRSLEEFSIYDYSIDSGASEISDLIRNCKNLRYLSLWNCRMSEATLIQILTSLASHGRLEHFNIDKIDLHSCSPSRDVLTKALVRVLRTNPLQSLSMDRREWDPSTINSIVDAIHKMETLTLCLWTLKSVKMPPDVRGSIDGLVDSKGGLLRVYL